MGANQPTTPAVTSAANARTMSGKACDVAKSGYLNSGSSLVADLAACSQSCQKSAQCKSVTFYSSSKWCSHFSTICTNFATDSGATSVTFQSGNKPTTPAV